MCVFCLADIVYCSNCNCICCEYCGEDFSSFYTSDLISQMIILENQENSSNKLFNEFQEKHSKWCLGEISNRSYAYYYCISCQEKRRREMRRKQK